METSGDGESVQRRTLVAAFAAGTGSLLAGCLGGESGSETESGSRSGNGTTGESGTITGTESTATTAGERRTTADGRETAAGSTETDDPGGADSDSAADSDADGGRALAVAEVAFAPERECDGSRGASVAFVDEAVRVTGCIRGPNGCHVAVPRGASVDGGTLRVTVTTDAEAGDGTATACTQALVRRGYETTVTTTGGVPSTVEVRHVEMGETKTVATAER